jgi:FkbM family methyltransferase
LIQWLYGLYKTIAKNGAALKQFINPLTFWIRKFFLPIKKIHVTIRTKTGAIYELKDDLLDDAQLEAMFGYLSPLYFPDQIAELENGGVVFDVGAFHGHFTIAILKKYPKARVIAIEPDPVAVQLLRQNIRQNDLDEKVKIFNVAVGVTSVDVYFAQIPGSEWSNHIVLDSEERQGEKLIKVTGMSMAEICQYGSPDYIKCNAEGAEFGVFKELFNEKIFPKWISLFMHHKHGDVQALEELLIDANYNLIPTGFTAKKPRYLCVYEGKEK